MWAPRDPGPAGWDRRRVRARLLAALAGLQELRGLRARQQAAVRAALASHPPPAPAAPRAPRAHERLEAVLVALQEQLNRLRCQDLGLKTHLDQLDQQISELQLDVCRTSTEGPDGDSRPSSGFYEMSDGGSCSLSASCTSVCSDRLSSSLGALLPSAPQARTSAGDGRPWSADGTTMCGVPLPAGGLQATEDGAGPSRPRPVSTGDLERAPLAGAGPPTAGVDAVSTLLLRRGLGPLPLRLDPTYQRDLVSKGGREVYLYPSPLHAVALQSPLFALPTETPQRDSPPQPSSQSLPGHSGPRPIRTGPIPEAGAARAYIDKLLGRRGLGGTPRGHVGEQGPPAQRAETERHPGGLTCSPRRADVGGGALRRDTGGNSLEQWGPAPCGSPPPPLPEEGQKPPRSCVHAGIIPGSTQLGGAPRALQATPTSREGTARLSTRMGLGPCVHPHSVVCSAAPVGLRTGQKPGLPTTKAVKMGRGASNRAPRPGRQPPPGAAVLAPLLPPTWGAGLQRRPSQARGAPGRSCSECSLYPVSLLVPLLVARREGHGASAQALFPREEAPGVASRAARQRQRRWRSSVEISARARLPGAQGPGLGPPRPASRRGGGPRPACSRARLRPPHRHPQARSESGSEHAAACASLFHSPATATSADRASGHTAGRFGDRESRGSDAEGGVQDVRGRPAWPRTSPPQPLRTPGSQPPLSPVPKLCRIKASKALKKKICRFQPTALKVMTLV
ncbi:dapper homolog 2 [Myotis daubentonii]|uniref:dapper homolog 2 n=1 Tax=Myotis daubentonii TaxID=98922 RepID=UPI002872BC84|nr:dapper homolog 2 [Myotis daubentonii]